MDAAKEESESRMQVDEEMMKEVAADEDDESWLNSDVEEVKQPPVKKRQRGPALYKLKDLLKNRQKRIELSNLTRAESESSDEDETEEPVDTLKRQKVEELLKTDHFIGDGESEKLLKWGSKKFGPQKPAPKLVLSQRSTGLIARTFKFKEVEGGEGTGHSSFAESMTSSGLLYSWAILEGQCDEETARWLFHQMAYSTDACLPKSACEVLCNLVALKSKVGRPLCHFKWLPSAEEIMETFHVYGYLGSLDGNESEGGNDIKLDGPSPNIHSVLRFLTAYFQVRDWYPAQLSARAAESLVLTFIHFLLERRLLNVSDLLHSCLAALLHCFTDAEWSMSSSNIVSSISKSNWTLGNEIRVVKFLHATDTRFGSLQRLAVLQFLSRHTESKKALSNPQDLIAISKAMRMKGAGCNFINIYHYLVLVDIYLWSESSLQDDTSIIFHWLEFLTKCSRQISTRDERPVALKARNWASFLRQKYQVEKMRLQASPE